MTKETVYQWAITHLKSPTGISMLLHCGIALLALALGWAFSRPTSAPTPIDVLEMPKQQNARPLSVRTAPKKSLKQSPPKKARAVFGQSRKAQTIQDPTAASLKAGNTLAKEKDEKVLRKDDLDYLPEPVEEFLVTQMPRLRDEIIIPYPASARERGVEGPVVMDILIDDKGKVRQAKLLTGPDSELNQAALRAVQRFEFIPAKVDGKAVPVRIRYAYRFVLER